MARACGIHCGMATLKTSMLLLAALLAIGLAVPASAQINPFGRDQRITNEDLRLIDAASAKLYKTETPQVGAVERWTNPATGNSGTVTLTQIFEKSGMPCRKLRHSIRVKGAKDPVIYIFDRCRVKSGEWKFA
jgi:surface antigen